MASLNDLYSIINACDDAKDRSRVFTFIEFIKEFGFDNSSDILLTLYREYLVKWANIKKRNDYLDDKEFVKEALTDTLKTITLSYSSYEEQDFLANLDWDNDLHKKAVIPFFAEKIRKICEFYKNKRHELTRIIDKNKFKGTRKSIEEVIYEKIIDFYFDRKNVTKQMEEFQRNLTITLEEYVDIYSEYFDIPRNKKCNDKTRQALLTANLNNVNHEDYLEVNKVISELIYSGEVYLKEIPLIAHVGLDLSAECAGDLEDLRQELLNSATLNQVSLSDQIAIRRRLYEKLLGCDLYYIYSDENKNLQSNILVKAENPTGNLLNCASADMALVESEQIKLISHIGLFFKPDKLGILKVHADNFVWEVNVDKIEPDTFYIFPDPAKYGDIGNNKDIKYPLVYEYKLDSVIKNLSSGFAKDEPLGFLSTPTWNTYYTKQHDDFKLIDNKDFKYSFTSFSDKGLLQNYQQDLYGNEYGLFKGLEINESDGTIIVPDFNNFPEIKEIDYRSELDNSLNHTKNIIINGGYFTDPRWPSNKKRIGKAFNYNERLRILENYIWTGVQPKSSTFFTPDILVKTLNFGKIERDNILYEDHYSKSNSHIYSADNKEIIVNVFDSFITDIADGKKIIKVNYTPGELDKKPGSLYINDKLNNLIFLIADDAKDFILANNTLVVVKNNVIAFYVYDYKDNNLAFEQTLNDIKLNEDEIIKILYNEKENKLLILSLNPVTVNEKYYFNLKISQYDCNTNKLEPNVIVFDNNSGNNFEYSFTKEKLDKCSFMFNNNTNTYVISYIIKDLDDSPNLFVHTFKLYNQEQFNNTLSSICYMMDNNINFEKISLYNETIVSPDIHKNITFFIKDHGKH